MCLGRLLQDWQDTLHQGPYGAELLTEAEGFHGQIVRAATASAVATQSSLIDRNAFRAEGGDLSMNLDGVSSVVPDYFFLPAFVGANQTPYASMTSDVLSSYSNFRYYSETLSAQGLPHALESAILTFRKVCVEHTCSLYCVRDRVGLFVCLVIYLSRLCVYRSVYVCLSGYLSISAVCVCQSVYFCLFISLVSRSVCLSVCFCLFVSPVSVSACLTFFVSCVYVSVFSVCLPV